MKAIQVPGKVMLSGEYAVLQGGSAVMAPVPRYLKLIETRDSNPQSYPAMVAKAQGFAIAEIEAYEAQNGKPDIIIDSTDFFAVDSNGQAVKLGLGLSAAEAVGVIALRFERAGIEWLQNCSLIHKYADGVHCQVQQGLGSGADVAACAYGRPLGFRRRDNKPIVEPIELDKIKHKIPLQLVWSERSADTRIKVGRFNDWLRSGGRRSGAMLNRLIESADKLADAWFIDPMEALYEKLDEFGEIMKKIARQAGLEYTLPIHDELDTWARKHNGRAKPTGAGGGDMILLIGDLNPQEIHQSTIRLTY